jgi:uridylate kinase
MTKLNKRKQVVISLGGSVLYNETGFDLDIFLKFISFIEKEDCDFIIVVGGGKVARDVIKEADKINLSNLEKDKLGIISTVYNATIVKEISSKISTFNIYPKVLKKPRKLDFSRYNLIYCAGYKPGVSTDTDAVLWAIKNNICDVINVTNVDYVYDKNPNEFDDANKLEQLSWIKYKSICGDVFKPGLNLPFDPIASSIAMKNNLRVFILSKENLLDISKCISFKNTKIKGTIIN